MNNYSPDEDITATILGTLRNDGEIGQYVQSKNISEFFPETGIKDNFPRVLLSGLTSNDQSTHTYSAWDGSFSLTILTVGEYSNKSVRDIAIIIEKAMCQDNLDVVGGLGFPVLFVSNKTNTIQTDGLTSEIVLTYTFRVTN